MFAVAHCYLVSVCATLTLHALHLQFSDNVGWPIMAPFFPFHYYDTIYLVQCFSSAFLLTMLHLSYQELELIAHQRSSKMTQK